MKEKRPPGVTIVGILFLATGAIGIARFIAESGSGIRAGELWSPGLAVIAIACGLFLFLRRNWARWGATLWMSAHVVISAFHSAGQTAAHAVFLVAIAYFLFRRETDAYFA